MAALRPCPFLTTAPASFNLDRSQLRTCGIILPLDRSNTTLKITRAPPDRRSTLLKSNHGIRAHSGAAGEPAGPDPEELIRRYMSPEQQKIWDECKRVAKGPPDMPFREEIDILREYWVKVRDEIFYDKSILHPEAASFSWSLCSNAHHAAVLASMVVDCALLRHDMEEISVHTIKQIVRTYVSIFVSTAEDSHHKKVTRETIFSFLGALQGVASISHIMLQDTLGLMGSKDTSSNYKIVESDVDRAHLDYQVEMNNLKHKLASAHRLDLHKLLAPTLNRAVHRTQKCIAKMTGTREMALGHRLPGAPKASDDTNA